MSFIRPIIYVLLDSTNIIPNYIVPKKELDAYYIKFISLNIPTTTSVDENYIHNAKIK